MLQLMHAPRTPVYRITDGAQMRDTYWYRIPPIGGSVRLPDLTFNPQEHALALILNSNLNKIIISSLHRPQRMRAPRTSVHPARRKNPTRRIVRMSLTLTWAGLHPVVGQYYV